MLPLIGILLPLFSASADVIPPDSHFVERCVRVANAGDFPDIVLIGYVADPAGREYDKYQVAADKCLTKGYKFDTLSIYWNAKGKGLAIDGRNLLAGNIDTYGGYADNASHVAREDVDYSLAHDAAGSLYLYKSRQVTQYDDGTPAKVEAFSSASPSASSSPAASAGARGFWHSFICFIVRLFGGACAS